MSSVVRWLRDRLSPNAAGARLSDDAERAFLVHCRDRFDRQGKLLMGAFLAGALLWWPTDPLVFRAFPDLTGAMARWRIGVGAAAALYLLAPRWPPVKRAIEGFFAVAVAVCCWTAGSTAGLIGGLDRPYFHMLYVVPFVTIPLPLPFARRVAFTAMLAAVTAAGYFVPHPEHLASAYAPLYGSFLVCMVAVGIWFGHAQFRLSRESFSKTRQLEENGRLLEARVADRTRELRRLLDHVESAREAERARIARELHDELGQELSALRYSVSFAKTRYASEPLDVAANLDEIADLLRRTSSTTRDLVTDLRPRVLDDLGLGAALEWLARRTEQRTGLTCRVTVTGSVEGLDDRVATTAFRVAQEALTNVVRHAEASSVQVDLTVLDRMLEVRVADDGIGLAASRQRSKRDPWGASVGLVGMRERAHALHGTLEVEERATEPGTEVRCRLPLLTGEERAATEEAVALRATLDAAIPGSAVA